jgi:alpha-beta hydrolase superfamily lysophospholipase
MDNSNQISETIGQENKIELNNLLNNLKDNPNSKSKTNKFEDFKDLRKFMNKDKNLIGVIDKMGAKFTRKYIPNILNHNVRLYYTNIKPSNEKTNIIASLCIVHGFGHYSQEFYEIAHFLALNGINCHLIDLRGHGLSGGCRMDWTIEDLHTDVITLIKCAEADGIDLPLFVFGHSLGGGLVSSLFINNQYLQVNGIILSSPLLGLPLNTSFDALKLFVISKAGNNLREFVVNGNINPSELCKDDREVARIISDKRVLPLASPRSFRSIIKNCERILENCR